MYNSIKPEYSAMSKQKAALLMIFMVIHTISTQEQKYQIKENSNQEPGSFNQNIDRSYLKSEVSKKFIILSILLKQKLVSYISGLDNNEFNLLVFYNPCLKKFM